MSKNGQAEEELKLARKIRATEEQALSIVARMLPGLTESTRALDWRATRVETALRTLEGDTSDSTKELRALHEKADQLRWQLAYLAKSEAEVESLKRAGRMEREDLLQEGMVGCYRAARRFDPDRGMRFTTYANWWVKAQVMRTIDDSGRDIRLTSTAVRLLGRINRAKKALGDSPTHQEIADHTGLDRETVESMIGITHVLRLDAPTPIEDSSTWRDTLTEEGPSPAARAERVDTVTKLRESFVHLTEDELSAVCLHFGIDCEPLPIKKVAKKMDTTPEYVQQCLHTATEFLRGQLQ